MIPPMIVPAKVNPCPSLSIRPSFIAFKSFRPKVSASIPGIKEMQQTIDPIPRPILARLDAVHRVSDGEWGSGIVTLVPDCYRGCQLQKETR